MKLFIGNKAYSSWSLRGWLAVKHSGLPFEEVTVPLYDEEWSQRREGDEFAPSGGKVPILWDGDDIVVWDSLAIIDYLNEKTGGTKGFWPEDMAARAMARSMAAEMHSSFAALRRNHSMNIRRIYPAAELLPEVQADVVRDAFDHRDQIGAPMPVVEADRQPPRDQGRRSRRARNARHRGGQLSDRPDQGRQDQGHRTRSGAGRDRGRSA